MIRRAGFAAPRPDQALRQARVRPGRSGRAAKALGRPDAADALAEVILNQAK
ncbi:hypothetical protein ACQP2K_00285 [Microbispora siamensis]